MVSASSLAVAKRPPSVPSVPTKSVSQNWQVAPARSCSRALQRLQPEKRQNTAARPACATSPCKVRKISLTAYHTNSPRTAYGHHFEKQTRPDRDYQPRIEKKF